MISKSLRFTAVFGGVLAAAAANATLVDPFYLLNGTGGEDNVQHLMQINGFGGSVGQISSNSPGNVLNYGDQEDNSTFVINAGGATQTWTRLWGIASLDHKHALGYYTNTGAGTINPGDITWVVWGKDSAGLGDGINDHWSGSVSGSITNGTIFGLVFSTGGGDTFYSQNTRNPAGADYMASIRDWTSAGGAGSWNGGLIAAWEDSTDLSLKDYNDFAVDIQGARAVPEPTTMAALGIGALALIRKRRNKK